MIIVPYQRNDAKNYAKKWAFSRNPAYYAFDKIGGDCTNFISQCIYAGAKVMNYTPTFGWYYIDSTNRSPSWTSVEYLYKFLTTNNGIGPFAQEVFSERQLEIGDVIQLGNYEKYYHSLLVVGINRSNIYVAAHDDNAYMRNLSTYRFLKARFLHIEGIRKEA